jgi:putative flavoprotein involved in K+ transport
VGGKGYTFLTTAKELKGFEEKIGPNRAMGGGRIHHQFGGAAEGHGKRVAREHAELGNSKQPYVVIIGGGQGGIALGARLKSVNVPHIILEKNDKAGDSWRKRYESLCLHDPVWFDHLPYIPFPPHMPVYPPKDMLGDWLEMYVKVMELNYWVKSECTSANYDEATKEWTIKVTRDGQAITLNPKHLVIATGNAGFARVPTFKGQETFDGTLYHSSHHRGGNGWAGKHAVVVGANNSAHDICADFYEHGAASVTMVQRSSTHVIKVEHVSDMLTPIYSDEAVAAGITTHVADMINASVPFATHTPSQQAGMKDIQEKDKEFYQRLEAAGFKNDFGEDGTGVGAKYVRTASGYYIDVGASELVADQKIKVANGSVGEITKNSCVLTDGTELKADIIVMATGYGSMNEWAAALINQEVADKIGICWGLGSGVKGDPGPWMGELRNMWKPTQQEGLWFHGGNLYQSRFHSHFLAVQLKARFEGLPTPVYKLPETHHTSAFPPPAASL